jgi:hypothetical protein
LKARQRVPMKIGYREINVDGERRYEHRYVVEQALGRRLAADEHVHHKNGIKTDNRLENLEVLSASNHHREHMTHERAKRMSALGLAARWGGKNSAL